MAAESQSDGEVLRSALEAAKKVAVEMQTAETEMAKRSDRDRWTEGRTKLAGVGQAAQQLAGRITSLTSTDQT